MCVCVCIYNIENVLRESGVCFAEYWRLQLRMWIVVSRYYYYYYYHYTNTCSAPHLEKSAMRVTAATTQRCSLLPSRPSALQSYAILNHEVQKDTESTITPCWQSPWPILSESRQTMESSLYRVWRKGWKRYQLYTRVRSGYRNLFVVCCCCGHFLFVCSFPCLYLFLANRKLASE